MRKACLLAVYELARRDERVVFVGSDITKQNLEKFAAEFPNRFFMEGIYEAHIIGMSAGLAFNGKIPYINTIATFLTRRCYEQILIDLALHQLPVRLLGSGGGTVYAPLGPTHLANEDIAILRAIPNMTIVAPCDADEMNRLMPQTLDWPGPLYVRIAKGGDKIVSADRHGFQIGKAILLREGQEVLLISTGTTTQIAMEAAETLAGAGVAAAVLHVHTLKPLDTTRILACAGQARVIITIEEHTLVGGLGSAVAETLLDAGASQGKQFARLGFPDVFTEELGSQNEIMRKYGLSAENLVAKAKQLLQRQPG